MGQLDKAQVAECVTRTINELRGELPGVRLSVIADEVMPSDDGWRVPIHPDQDLPRATAYYDFLSHVEESVKQAHGIDVFIVPSRVLPQAG